MLQAAPPAVVVWPAAGIAVLALLGLGYALAKRKLDKDVNRMLGGITDSISNKDMDGGF